MQQETAIPSHLEQDQRGSQARIADPRPLVPTAAFVATIGAWIPGNGVQFEAVNTNHKEPKQ